MRIALTIPSFWPYVRRGERLVNGLAHYLINQGHEVTIITSKPGPQSKKIRKDNIKIIYNREYANPLFSGHLGKYRYHMFAWSCFNSLLRENFDIIQSLFYVDAFGATISNHFTGNKIIFYIPNCEPFHFGGWIDKYMYKKVIRSAVRIAPSRYLQRSLKERYGLEAILIPPGVDTEYFKPVHKKDLDQPKILCLAELGESRKRVPLLIKAFELFKKYVPNAILQLSGRISNKTTQDFLELVNSKIRDSIKILGVGNEEGIPSLYANATMTVLPSIRETFGMVLVESLAAGTPVVATRDGGIPEIVDDPRVGVMFDGEGEEAIEALCNAMLQCLELSQDPNTSSNCCQHSRRYDWSVIGPKLEDIYKTNLN